MYFVRRLLYFVLLKISQQVILRTCCIRIVSRLNIPYNIFIAVSGERNVWGTTVDPN